MDTTAKLKSVYDKECQWGHKKEIMTTEAGLMKYLTDPNSPQSTSCTGNSNALDYLIRYLNSYVKVKQSMIFLRIEDDGRIIDQSCEQIVNNTYGENLLQLGSAISRAGKTPIIVYLTLHKKESGHANLIFVDTVNKTYERFEPHGSKGSYDENDQINEYLRTKPEFKGFRYISTLDFCPRIGPQAKENRQAKKACKIGGYCVVYSILYAHLRLISGLSREGVVDLMTKWTGQEILDIILRYLYLLETYVHLPYQSLKGAYSTEVSHAQKIYDLLKDKESCQLTDLYKQLEIIEKDFKLTRLSPFLDPVDESSIKEEIDFELDDLNNIEDQELRQYDYDTPYRKQFNPAEYKLMVLKAYLAKDLLKLIEFPQSYKWLGNFFKFDQVDQALFNSGRGFAFDELVRVRSKLSLPHMRAKFLKTAVLKGNPRNIYLILSSFKYDPITAQEAYFWLLTHPDETYSDDIVELIPGLISENFADQPAKIKKIKAIVKEAMKSNPKLQTLWDEIKNN
jgi:hypothetical protein